MEYSKNWAKKACDDVEGLLEQNTKLLSRVEELKNAVIALRDGSVISEEGAHKIINVDKAIWSKLLISLK